MTEDLLILGELIAEQAAHMDAAEHRLLTNIREFDRQEGWASTASCAHWLSWRVGWTLSTAREHVRVAKALGSLPHIDEALRVGKVSYCKVRAMTRVATPANEQVLLMDAQLTTGSQLERVCRKYRQLQRNEQAANPADDDQARFLRRRDLDNGMVSIEAVCRPEEAALIWAVIEQATKELFAASQAEERAGANGEPEPANASTETCSGATSADASDSSVRIPEQRCENGSMSGGCGALTDVSAETCPRVASGEVCEPVEGAYALEDADEPDADEIYEDDCAFFERFGVCPEPRPVPSRVYVENESQSAATTTSASTVRSPSRLNARSTPISSASATSTSSTRATLSATATGLTTATSSTPATGTPTPPGKRAVMAKANGSANLRPRFDRLDGLLALMRNVAAGGSLKSPVEVVVTVSAEALANRAEPNERIAFLQDDGCIGAETARRLCCDAGIVCMVEDEHGNPLSVGRRTRSIPTSIGRALVQRDPCCRFPGCTRRVYLQGHHLEHWALGGETALYNLVRLCTRHHTFVHEYGYRVEMDATGQPVFFDPQGRPAKDIPPRILRDDLGWEHILGANQGLGIEPHVCGWSGERIEYDEVCHALYRVDAGLLKPEDIC